MFREWFLRAASAGLVCLALSCSSSSTGGGDDDGGDDVDNTPPATVADLRVQSVTTSSVTLVWTAPGDDGATEGFAWAYDLRGSLDSITPESFSSATAVTDTIPVAPPGYEQRWTIDELNSGETYYFALRTRDPEGNWSGVSNCCRADCPGNIVITFADANLEAVVRQKVNMPTGDIMVSDVDTISEINGEGQSIADLGGIQYFSHLEILHLRDNDLTDISDVAGLVDLKILGVAGNNLADISPISGLVELDQLIIGDNPITDLSPVSTLTGLQLLNANAIQATDYAPLASLTNLTSLWMSNNYHPDLSYLTDFLDLQELVLNTCGLTDLSPLAGDTSLHRVYLVFNQLSDITPLQTATGLSELDLRYNQIEDIRPLVNNAGISAGDIVNLDHNSLSVWSTDTGIVILENRGVTVTY